MGINIYFQKFGMFTNSLEIHKKENNFSWNQSSAVDLEIISDLELILISGKIR